MTDYYELAELADRIFSIAEDDVEKLAEVLDTLDAALRWELLESDFLNAYQVFYYLFRETPTLLAEERLILQAASSLGRGAFFEEWGVAELVFVVKDRSPLILVTDGGQVLKAFEGASAYRDAVSFAEETY
ncbi:MAG: hypothetical protein QCH35_02195 [Methanomicrobiaceae archaeon]|nr:hypothetical protein [Methanomicrobiaceae archaeon]